MGPSWHGCLGAFLMKYFKYFNYIIRHKWFVFVECCKLDIVWRGIIHDWSKFLPSEFIPYAQHFYGGDRIEEIKKEKIQGYDKSSDTNDNAFNKAWLYHIHRNKHHWQYWVLIQDEGEDMVLEMPDRYKKELLADWHGAGKSITGKNNTKTWYYKNKVKMQFTKNTRLYIEAML